MLYHASRAERAAKSVASTYKRAEKEAQFHVI
jgi:hypothetical protein